MSKKIWLCLILAILMFANLSAKIRVLTFYYNKPEFIELQIRCLDKFLTEDYEFIVFNDAREPKNIEDIQKTCEKYQVKCIRYEQDWHEQDPLNDYLLPLIRSKNVYSHLSHLQAAHVVSLEACKHLIAQQPSIRHAHVMQYALDHYGYDHNDIVIIMDGDAFLIRQFNLRAMMKKADIVGIKRITEVEKCEYVWVPFLALNMPILPNKQDLRFHADVINNKLEDTGSHSFFYFKRNPKLRVVKLAAEASQGLNHWHISQIWKYGFTRHEANFIKSMENDLNAEFCINRHVLHFGNVSFILEHDKRKQVHMEKFLRTILNAK